MASGNGIDGSAARKKQVFYQMSNKITDKKTLKERQASYDSLPPIIKDSLSEEEKESFLNDETWSDELFVKLDEFILKK